MLDALVQFIISFRFFAYYAISSHLLKGLVFSIIILRVALGVSIDSRLDEVRGEMELRTFAKRQDLTAVAALEVRMTQSRFVSDDKNVVVGIHSENQSFTPSSVEPEELNERFQIRDIGHL